MADMLHACLPIDTIEQRIGDIVLRLAPERETVAIAPYRDRISAVQSAIAAEFDAMLPEAPWTAQGNGARFMCGAHHQWLATAEPDTGLMARITQVCGTNAAVVDQTDSRFGIMLSGPGAAAIAAKLVPVDLHGEVFLVGHSAMTLAGHIPVLFCRTARDTYEFIVFRSFAESLHHDIVVALRGGIPSSEPDQL